MAEYVKIKRSLLVDIATAIRNKFALGGQYTPAQMADTINNIVIDGDAINENKFITGTWTEYTNNEVREIATGTFYGSDNLTSVSFPSVITISGSDAFNSCSSLISVNFPKLESVTSLNVFQYCPFTDISLPELTTVTGNYMFRYCTSLKNVDVPKLKKVGYGMFYNCSSLERLDLPSATEIGVYAFYTASKLITLILRSPVVCTIPDNSASQYTFTGTPIASGTGYIYVPASLVDTYKSANIWSTYANQIRAIEDYQDICGTTE